MNTHSENGPIIFDPIVIRENEVTKAYKKELPIKYSRQVAETLEQQGFQPSELKIVLASYGDKLIKISQKKNLRRLQSAKLDNEQLYIVDDGEFIKFLFRKEMAQMFGIIE